MSNWSPEELVKQLRLPDRIHIGRLMRDAADMIDSLRAELAEQRRELKATQAGWLIEINKVARVQELCDERDESARSVYTASWVFVSDVLAAIEGNEK